MNMIEDTNKNKKPILDNKMRTVINAIDLQISAIDDEYNPAGGGHDDAAYKRYLYARPALVQIKNFIIKTFGK